jgi:predicted O-methyltransferase YrrM
MIFFRFAKYLKHIVLAKHWRGHGIHSPFIFDLVSRVFRNKTDKDIVCIIEKIRKRLKSDRRLIAINDLGAGSERRKTTKRKVSDIARYSSVPIKYGVLLSNLAAEFGRNYIIEFGTSFGISTMYLAAGSPESVIFTIEGDPAAAEIAKDNFREARFNNISLFTGSFEEMIPVLTSGGKSPGLVFIDGNHRKEPVLKYFNSMAEAADSKTVIIIDDIYYSNEMETAWNEIKADVRVSVTVDIFRMGLVFFREGINHHDYIVRH